MDRVNELLKNYRTPILLSLLGGVLILGGMFSSSSGAKTKTTYAVSSSAKPVYQGPIKVDVAGAVENPAVYNLSSDARVEDAIKLAGGFSDNANADFISKTLNLSQKLTDGEKLYIPFQGESVGGVVGSGGAVGAKLDVNSASEADLDNLPGVGPATAQKIIQGRPYSVVDDLINKKSVTKSIYDKIKDLIEVN